MGIFKKDTIFVSNLPYSVEEKEVVALFKEFGVGVKSVRLPMNKAT